MLGQNKWTRCGIHVALSTLGVRGPGQGVESGRRDPTLTGEDGVRGVIAGFRLDIIFDILNA
jgi:hypothetical protein